MTYNDALQYLDSKHTFASQPTLERMKSVLSLLQNPQEHLRVIHIAGTNGKGSACAMLSSILMEGGYRTGVYTSPHLQRCNERIRLNAENISDRDFADILEQVMLAERIHCANGGEALTYFEVLTCGAFLYFHQARADIVILETGLGGRFDATNVVTSPLLSIIMSISFDHTAFLGNSLEAIAFEKGGIIKKNCPVVLYYQQKIVYNVIKQIAQSLQAPLYFEETNVVLEKQDLQGTVFSAKNNLFAMEHIVLPLLGTYQIENCITVLNACAVLCKNDIFLSEEAIRKGLFAAKWSGRMEIMGTKPLILLDGAHNADGIRRLAESLHLLCRGKKITILLGVLADKAYEEMISFLLPLAHKIILTEPHSSRKLPVDILKQHIHTQQKIYLEQPDLARALDLALAHTKEDEVLLCCGSLYMIGDLRTLLAQKQIEMEAESDAEL